MSNAVTLAAGGDRVTLCEVLDRVLNKGVVAVGEIVITVADVELLYVGVQLVISSVETMRLAREQSCRERGS